MSLLIIKWDINPEFFDFYGIHLRYYSLLFMAGLLISFNIIKIIFKKENIDIKYSETLFAYGVIGVLLGARLGHAIFYDFEYYSKHILEIFIPFSKINGSYQFIGYAGLASHGGVIGLLISLFIYSKKYKINIIKLLDIVSIVAPLGGAFIRLGNFMNSEIIGKETELPWGIIFERVDNIPRHPTQLYEAICYFIIFIILLKIYNNKIFNIGSGVFLAYCSLLVFTSRFLLEFIKIKQSDFEENLYFNMGQILSIPIIIISLLYIIKKYIKTNKKNKS